MKTILFSTFIFLTSGFAFAAQCNVLPNEMASEAIKILSKHKKLNPIAVIDIYCEACRDEYPKAMVLDSFELKKFQIKGFQQIIVNDKNIDLAYTYIDGENVANMIGCKAFGVNKYL